MVGTGTEGAGKGKGRGLEAKWEWAVRIPGKTQFTCSGEQNEEQRTDFQTTKTVPYWNGVRSSERPQVSLRGTCQIMEVGVRRILWKTVEKIRKKYDTGLHPKVQPENFKFATSRKEKQRQLLSPYVPHHWQPLLLEKECFPHCSEIPNALWLGVTAAEKACSSKASLLQNYLSHQLTNDWNSTEFVFGRKKWPSVECLSYASSMPGDFHTLSHLHLTTSSEVKTFNPHLQ